MIKVESVEIEEVRGIRKLSLDLNRECFAISGPNGSGKSGVVDAVEFGLTGEIRRLTGKGTGGIKLSEHGPHVDKRDYPDAPLVRLKIHIPSLGKSATITRKIKKPRELKIEPEDAEVRAVLEQVAQHPEVSLSRREIIKFILIEATKRSQEVQALLKLDDIDQARSTLKTTQNKLTDAHAVARTQVSTTADGLRRSLDITTLSSAEVLEGANKRRAVLGLPAIENLDRDTSLSQGIEEAAKGQAGGIAKETALRDLKALREEVEAGAGKGAAGAVASITEKLNKLADDPSLLDTIQRRAFVQTGLDLLDSPACPLCDKPWNLAELREHLEEKLRRSQEAEELQNGLLEQGRLLSREATRLVALIEAARNVATGEGKERFVTILSAWHNDLTDFKAKLTTVKDLVSVKGRLESSWTGEPAALLAEIQAAETNVAAKPDEGARIEAQKVLVVAQDRLEVWRRARRQEQAAEKAAEVGKAAYRIYCDVAEKKLTDLYKEVQEDFCKFYRALNKEDEGDFLAKFAAGDGKLDLSVDFYKRGMFPPGAYHSEGHQDAMGVCLYLALMKRLWGKDFTLAVLDDVVMSVDTGHRRRFCRLLATEFPDTQFVITTHDRVWARQMRSEGLIKPSAGVVFQSWSVETGPVLEESTEIWEAIEADLAKGGVSEAAAKLRSHLEYCASELADGLGAKVTHRADGNYQLGDLLPAVVSRQGELLKKAAKSAQDWGNDEAAAAVEARRTSLRERQVASSMEQWAVNPAVHYNAWANFEKDDFEPVVEAFRVLLEEFRCGKCGSWVETMSSGIEPEALSCRCGAISLNLRAKA